MHVSKKAEGIRSLQRDYTLQRALQGSPRFSPWLWISRPFRSFFQLCLWGGWKTLFSRQSEDRKGTPRQKVSPQPENQYQLVTNVFKLRKFTHQELSDSDICWSNDTPISSSTSQRFDFDWTTKVCNMLDVRWLEGLSVDPRPFKPTVMQLFFSLVDALNPHLRIFVFCIRHRPLEHLPSGWIFALEIRRLTRPNKRLPTTFRIDETFGKHRPGIKLQGERQSNKRGAGKLQLCSIVARKRPHQDAGLSNKQTQQQAIHRVENVDLQSFSILRQRTIVNGKMAERPIVSRNKKDRFGQERWCRKLFTDSHDGSDRE